MKLRQTLSVMALVAANGLGAWAWAQTAPVPGAPGAQGAPGAPGERAWGPGGPHRGGPGMGHGHAGPGHAAPGHAGPGGRHGQRMGGAGPAMMLLGPGLDRALDMVQATPEQRADIRRIAGAARDDLRASRQQVRNASRAPRDAFLTAWSADQVDGNALELERQRMAAQRDAAAKRVIKAAVDIGQVLRPEQRRQLAEHWRRHAPQRRAEGQPDLDWDLDATAAAD